MMLCRLIVAAVMLLPAASCVEPGHENHEWSVLGTVAGAEVHTVGPEAARNLVGEIKAAIAKVDMTMNGLRENSLISRLNREAHGEPFVVDDPDTFRCIKLAVEYAKRTEGAFDPYTAGWENVELFREASAVRLLDAEGTLELDGLVLGYALDAAARRFTMPGARAGLVRLGDNLFAWGAPPDSAGWDLTLSGKADPAHVWARINMSNRAVSFDGDWSSLWRGREGAGTMAVMVIADAGVEADALAAAFMDGGAQRTGEILERSRRIEAAILTEAEAGPTLLASGSLEGALKIDPEFAELIGGRVRFILPPASL